MIEPPIFKFLINIFRTKKDSSLLLNDNIFEFLIFYFKNLNLSLYFKILFTFVIFMLILNFF